MWLAGKYTNIATGAINTTQLTVLLNREAGNNFNFEKNKQTLFDVLTNVQKINKVLLKFDAINVKNSRDVNLVDPQSYLERRKLKTIPLKASKKNTINNFSNTIWCIPFLNVINSTFEVNKQDNQVVLQIQD